MKTNNNLKLLVLLTAVVTLVSVIPAGARDTGSAIPALRTNDVSFQTAAKADLSGKWDLNVSTDGGPVSAKAEFKVAANGAITGTVESAEYGSSTITSGSVTDASFSIKFNINAGDTAVEVNMGGTIDEKSMKGSGSAGDASFSFTGTRASSGQN
jgi:hypothetical protein